VFFQHRPPIDPSSLTRWRTRIGEEGAEWLLTKTIEAGRRSGAVDDGSHSRVTVDSEPNQETTWGVVSPANGDGEEYRASGRRTTV
jgi:IS5 family transposase